MNIRTIFLSSLFIAFTTMAFSQKVDIKKDLITFDGDAHGMIAEDKAMRGCFYITDANANELLYFKWVVADDLNYFEVYRPQDLNDILYEEQATSGFKKNMAKKLYNAGALTPTGMDDDKLTTFAQKMGNPFSRKREERLRK